jgi:hypothetical protein
VTGGPAEGPEPQSEARQAQELVAGADPSPKRASPDSLEDKKKKADLSLRKRVGNGALIVMVVQILIADVAFYIYGFANAWEIPGGAMNAWLAATVIQVVSVVLVITKYLFPSGGER